jgi:hypothetical protein
MRESGLNKSRIKYTLLLIVFICGFVFLSGCSGGSTAKPTTGERNVTTEPQNTYYPRPVCSPPGPCDNPDTCPPDCYPYKCPSGNCPGGCGMVCIKTMATPSQDWTKPPIPSKFQKLKIGDEAIVSIRGQNIAVTVESFKEYPPDKQWIKGPEGCLQTPWYKLQIKYRNVGDNLIPYPYASGHLEDIRGNYIDSSYCNDDNVTRSIDPRFYTLSNLGPNETRYQEFIYEYPDYAKIQKGAVFIYSTQICPVEELGCRPYNDVWVNKASWIVAP